MKVSLNWAQYVSNVDLKSIPVDVMLQKIGAQLGAVEDVEYWGPRFDGIVVVKVMSCEPHPNADKLHVCRVDDGGAVKGVERGDDGLVQVVCGAPNVKAGLLAAWLPPGSTVPSTIDKDPFVLGAREIRGVVSNGMMASPAELGLSDNHDGILEISAEEVGKELAKPGTPFKQLYGLDDVVIDCENKMFTHRPDCFGILGVARELAGINNLKFVSPDWYAHEPSFKKAHDTTLKISVGTELVPRFMGVVLQNVQVKPSPMYMQAGLVRVGIRPINNIVDITNWMMHLTGQPLHAYDYDKVMKLCGGSTATLQARLSKKGETVALLNGKTLELDDKTIVIATDKAVVGIGGVMGGADTEVDANTKNIILEAATFDMYAIRKTAMKYGLFTDAVTRFNKGQSPLQNARVLAEAMRLVRELSGGHQASDVQDYKDERVTPLPLVSATSEFINERLGSNLTTLDMQLLLENVECVPGASGTSESRSYIMGVGDIDEKLARIGVKVVEKTDKGHYKVLIPHGSEDDYEKLIAWELQPGFWNEYLGARNVFLFKDHDTKVSRYTVSDDSEHEIIEMCRTFAGEYYTSLEAMLQGNDWYRPLLPLHKHTATEPVEPNVVAVSPPFWRRDLELPEDLVEEVGRLYGFDKLPVNLPRRNAVPAHKNEQLKLAQRVRETLAAAGANELLTYSFVHGKLLEQVGQDPKLAFHIRNAISPDLQYYRMSLTPSLLDKVHLNIKAGFDHFAIFEIGKTHNKVEAVAKDDVPQENGLLALVIASKQKLPGAAFYEARAYLDYLANQFGVKLTYKSIKESIDYPVMKPFEPSRSALVIDMVSEQILGVVGEYRSAVRKNLKLPDHSAGFEIGMSELLAVVQDKKSYAPVARFPKSLQDATYEVSQSVAFADIEQAVDAAVQELEAEHGYRCDVLPGDIYVPEGSDRKRFSFRFSISHPERTLTTEEVNKCLDKISERVAAEHAGRRI